MSEVLNNADSIQPESVDTPTQTRNPEFTLKKALLAYEVNRRLDSVLDDNSESPEHLDHELFNRLANSGYPVETLLRGMSHGNIEAISADGPSSVMIKPKHGNFDAILDLNGEPVVRISTADNRGHTFS